ncbi:Calmodulin-binding transcription activator 3 [Camellia lanceoleosa]|uniref:Calmodulin-binding transcription activator 3 n=1 Tax=Camellia lanceoleosa TaxID=1840588 RepID=A0ACC0J2L4_9ERIC|nr:Calmodulin-binding transcription activator 3 [Camellia lanceoleosa]
MAEPRRYSLGTQQLDIEQILLEAQHRWLRPAEICEILQNYKKFRIAPEPANKPPSGSLFLFDRKVLRYFRKDGHNWRKKKDGKTVKEAHERLKAGSVDVLHCYYAHGEENENFQRRSYWLLEEERSNIVLVHYREVKGNRANFSRIKEAEETIPNSQESEEIVPNSEVDSSVSSTFNPYNYQVTSHATDTASLNSAQASEYEDAESGYNHQASSGFHSFLELQPHVVEKMEDGLSVPYYPVPFSNDYEGKLSAIPGMDFVPLVQGDKGKNSVNADLTFEPQKQLDFSSWKDVVGNSGTGIQSDTISFNPGQGNELLEQILTNDFGKSEDAGIYPPRQDKWQTSEGDSSHISKWSMDQKLYPESEYYPTTELYRGVNSVDLLNSAGPFHAHSAEQNEHHTQSDLQIQSRSALKPASENNPTIEGKAECYPLKQPLLDSFLREGLKKLDSFDRWMSKELGDVNESHTQSNSGTYWETVETEDGVDDSSIAPQAHLETYMLGPSLSQDQLFSIIDFSPNWAYAGSEIKVLITGKFLMNQQDVDKCKWSCMFGEVEVPAEVIADGVLRCHTPLHKDGRVPFYVTCSNRLACSEVREFEYRIENLQDVDIPDIYCGSTNEILLRMRFGKLLSLESGSPPSSVSSTLGENSHLSNKISSLLREDNNEWEQMLMLTSEDEFSPEEVKEQLLQKLLKEKLHLWLLQKVAEGGKGPSVLDEGGQGVLHFAAALGYDWAIPPTLAAGVSVNFRDVNGWTALHWAAYCGRERTVVFLLSLDAAPGALTDPSPIYPDGQTPADLASSKGHKGIAGYLAESALSSHLQSLQLKDTKHGDEGQIPGVKNVQTVSKQAATPIDDGDFPHGLSLKDSLAAVYNATQAAARIHQVYRVQSFQRKQLKQYGNDKFGMSDERALSLVVVKSRLGRHNEPVHAAAIRIQNKFRSWKGRREFLTIRQQIVKIQAHVRGHQVRKNYRSIIWSVGILEKVILRWRRKGSGLRGFRQEALTQGSSKQDTPSNEDDYDFLKEGRKQTEERFEKALARVKSMVQYPEARDQYRRLLNVVTEMQETKAVYDKVLNSTEDTADFDDDLIDFQALLDDDSFMSTEY